MNKFLFTVALLTASVATFAQNRLVNKAEYAIKENKLDEAQTLLTEALNSGVTKNMSKAWNLQAEVYQRKFAEELNKASQKQPLDTLKFEQNLFSCLDAYDKCHQFDTKKEFYLTNLVNMKKYRLFVYYAGFFNLQNGKPEAAYQAFDKWMKYPTLYKLLEGDNTLANDSTTDKAEVAYYACYAAYLAKDFKNVGTYLSDAMNYDKDIKTVRQLHMMSLLENGDTLQWVKVAREYATSDEGTAQNLLSYYSRKGENEEALKFAEQLLEADPYNKIANYAKGVVLFGMQKYSEALPFFDNSIDIDPNFTDAYYNAGLCWQRIGLEKNEEVSKKKFKTKAEMDAALEEVKDKFRKSEEYFVALRDLLPDEPNKWAYNLKSIYYTLGLKDKEAEMDAYLN